MSRYAIPKRNQHNSLGSRSINSTLSSMGKIKSSQLKMIYFKMEMEFYCKINADYQKHNTTIPSNVKITPYKEIDL